MTLHKEISYKSVNYDIQDNSEDQNDKNRRRISAKPLNLNKQQLQKRLLTLLDYNTWKRTKPLRVNLNQIDTSVNEPIINAAVSYGNKNGHNQVLQEFLQHYGEQKHTLTENQHQHENFSLRYPKDGTHRAQTEKKPSFLNYKRSYTEVDKIHKMIVPKLSMKSRFDKPIQKAKTQSNHHQHNKSDYRHIPFPKELRKLKNKLKGVTSFSQHQRRSELSQHSRQPQQITTLDSNGQKNSVNQIKKQTKVHFNKMEQVLDREKKIRNGRRQYKEQISRILDRSLCYLQNREQTHQIRDLKVSHLSMNSESPNLSNAPIQQISPLSPQYPSNRKPHQYWPNHSNNIEQQYYYQMQRIANKYKERIQYGLDAHQQQNQILKVIKDEFRRQQKQFDKQMITEERQSFSKKFEYKIGLQRQNYKRNIKQFLRCKKDYYLQKQREEIRANGIKNIKKINDSPSKKKFQPEKINQQSFQ